MSSESNIDTRPVVGIVQSIIPRLYDVIREKRPDLRIEFNLTELKKDEETLQQLKKCDILLVFGALFCQLDVTYDLPNVKWMHTLAAGVDRYVRPLDKSKPPPHYTFTRNPGFFGKQMAEFVVGQILALEKSFKQIYENQKNAVWKMYYYRCQTNLSIGIIGCGDVGKEVARLCKAMHMIVWAVVRTMPSEDEKCPNVDHYRLWSELPEMLSSCDYICTILPSTPSTDGLLDGNVLEPCKHKSIFAFNQQANSLNVYMSIGAERKSVFFNIGRENCIKNETVLHALDEGWLSHAVLDVMEEEPLPASSPLWSYPNVTITPHVSGYIRDEERIIETFLKNYDRFVKGEPLEYVVDWKKGY